MDYILEEIISFLDKAHNSFSRLKFKVGYGCSSNTYIVEVRPLEEFSKNEEYAKMEIDFCDSFELMHPEHTIIFVSEEGICKVDNPLKKIGYEDKPFMFSWNQWFCIT